MGTRPPRLSAIALAVGFALSAFVLSMFAWTQFGGPVPLKAQKYRFHALFGSEASQLGPNSQVRISGVKVGTIVKVLRKPGRADVEMQLDSAYAPLPKSARAIVRFKTLLGESFVELTPGDPDGPKVADGGTLAASNVAPVQSIDAVLGAFDGPTRRALKEFVGELSSALSGRGEDLNIVLGSAGPAIEDLKRIVTVLDHQRNGVRRLIRDGGTVLETLGSRDGELQSLITEGDRVFSATAGRNRELTETVKALPDFLRHLRETSTELGGAAGDAAPILRALRPVAPLFPAAIRDTAALAPQAETLFRRLGPVITAAEKGLPAATRLVKAARPLVRVLYPAARELVPVVDLLDAYKRDVLTFGANMGAALNGSSPGVYGGERHHYVRFLSPINNEGGVGYVQRAGSNRHNPYLAPNGLANLGKASGLLAFDCRNAGNPTPAPPVGTVPPCNEQPPWSFRGKTRAFPRLERDSP